MFAGSMSTHPRDELPNGLTHTHRRVAISILSTASSFLVSAGHLCASDSVAFIARKKTTMGSLPATDKTTVIQCTSNEDPVCRYTFEETILKHCVVCSPVLKPDSCNTLKGSAGAAETVSEYQNRSRHNLGSLSTVHFKCIIDFTQIRNRI